MFKYILLIPLALFLTSCEDDGASSQVSFSITPAKPIVIMASTILRTITIVDGEVEEGLTEIPAPWADIGFNITNDFNKVITIVGVTISVTGPDGKIRNQSLLNFDAIGEPLGYFVLIRPENDVDCDGLVSEAEAALVDPVLNQPCKYDQYNPSFNRSRIKIFDFLEGVEDISQYAGASYSIKIRFEGWIGDLETPELNFVKDIYFTAESNF